MKNLLVVCLGLILFSIDSSAQVQKGAILTGGGLNFNMRNDKEEFSVLSSIVYDKYKTTFMTLNPRIGLFISQSTLLGVGLTYEHTNIDIRYSSNGAFLGPSIEKRNVLFVNPYFTKFNNISDKLYFTTTINGLVGIGKGKFGEDDEIETNIFGFRVNVSPGIVYFISERLALNGGIGQLFYNYEQETLATDIGLPAQPKNKNHNYGLSFSLNTFRIGLQYYLHNGGE